MQKRTVTALFVLCATLSLSADQSSPVFYFGGKRLFVGLSKSEAVALLSECCELSPSTDSNDDKLSAETGRMIGHFISAKGESTKRILGTIFFVRGKVARIARPLDEDGFDPESADVVAFARTLNRVFSLPEVTDSTSTVVVTVRHERTSNAEAEFLSLSFPNGRGVELQIVTLDTPSKATGKRDSISLDEILGRPRQ